MTTVTEPERVDVVYSLIVDPETEQILIVGHRDGYRSLPGGAREPGETLAETAIRETMEEAGDDEEVVRFKWVDAREANRLLLYWSMDFALHKEYRAFYNAAEWEGRDLSCQLTGSAVSRVFHR